MKRIVLLFISLAFLISACNTAEGIEVHEAWARPTAQGENAAAYFQLHNHTQSDDELTGASSTIADMVEMHESKMKNDVMQMNMVMSIPLASGDEISFEPGGLHVMLVGIKQELKIGDHFDLVLHFKNHADITVNVLVEDGPPTGDDHAH